MKDSSHQLLEKAARAIDAAEMLLQNDHIEFAVGRVYYAMFYAAEALLNEKDLQFSKHGGVHGAFGKHFVKTGLFDPKYHRWLLNAFDRRIVGDYSVEHNFTNTEVKMMIGHARQFLQETQRYLAE
ncbi:MAG: HEPN domain-containing protein [Chloroflexi bacterium]|nr:HEPN domain-containing protein [Chloroflexota bacterium]